MPVSKNIVICDDDEFMIQLLTIALEEEGHVVRSVTRCEDIWDLLARQLPDIILMDYYVPGSGGAETVRQIRERWGDAIQIIMISAADDIDKSSMEAGANAVLFKPFRVDALQGMFADTKGLLKNEGNQ